MTQLPNDMPICRSATLTIVASGRTPRKEDLLPSTGAPERFVGGRLDRSFVHGFRVENCGEGPGKLSNQRPWISAAWVLRQGWRAASGNYAMVGTILKRASPSIIRAYASAAYLSGI